MRVRPGRGRNLLVATTVALVALTACSGRTGSPPGVAASSAPAPADTVNRALDDLERFWTATYPTISDGKPFPPIQGGFHPYTQADPPPPCGSEAGVYQPNAFYCPDGDFIAWDAEKLIPELQTNFGQLLVALVMAHEYGHAIQHRLGVTNQPTVVLEQQADCFAGAWLADALAGRSTAAGGITPAQIDSALAGMLQLRDQPGTSATSAGAHGNAFDRIRALQDGVQNGATTCAGYRADNLPITEVPFTQERDAASGGNLPYDEAVDVLVKDAAEYWSRAYPQLTGQPWKELTVQPFAPGSAPECASPDAIADGAAFYCPEGDFIAFDNEQLGPTLYDRAGDNAVGMLVGDLYARAAQHRRGQSTQGDGQLTVDCLNGSWTYDLLHRDARSQQTQLSPGDLDEAVAALLAFGRATAGTGPSGFDRIAAYRNGVLKGLSACG
ncbi:zinc metallopeptidase [Actinoplanes sp. TBRC 11911]|uniref:neutral zinc metallopeptidase n=1 Tax=Actinoplanes sp. TBRC 11911 TaxID=2729386 RepID=UPI00145C5A21|nr:neutral zinc metallopeptidase [Actinoplanes sp. TBRC 11911]NMO57559.1 zinc metallopeptidase [Actinoplanes sp. TBRC 11911]